MEIDHLYTDSVSLLKQLIETPSLSGKEEKAAEKIRQHLQKYNVQYQTLKNNTWSTNKHWRPDLPVILLNSHIDTVKPVDGWVYDPFKASCEGEKLIGLGSNDAGAPLVSLMAVFLYFYSKNDLPFNLIYAATAEEESSGKNGMESLVKVLDRVDFAIVGEPTQMELAVAEKGLMVLDCAVHGKAGHAARNEGVNSIYLAIDEIQKIKNYQFSRVSDLLGEVKMTVTQIDAGFQHNVVPDICKFVVDVRTNECYTNHEIIDEILALLNCDVKARSRRLNSSGINLDHPFVQKVKNMGIRCYGSPTLSDQSLMNFRSVKMGPGDSARSHTANEFIYLHEIRSGIERYIQLLDGLILE
ncbi:MAG: M20 family metallo-hydrolase [Prolixibacteraceae bacterium]|nr:M20 family metallo-hydrolase [Prolixibacteraceae bacterium]MBN2649971.1 M20 family metallo-hydrolase [Prolixibacteraceae bacterium]